MNAFEELAKQVTNSLCDDHRKCCRDSAVIAGALSAVMEATREHDESRMHKELRCVADQTCRADIARRAASILQSNYRLESRGTK